MGKRAFTFLFYLHSSITNPQSFVLPDTTGSTFVCRGLVNTNEDALQTYSSELCLCSLYHRKAPGSAARKWVSFWTHSVSQPLVCSSWCGHSRLSETGSPGRRPPCRASRGLCTNMCHKPPMSSSSSSWVSFCHRSQSQNCCEVDKSHEAAASSQHDPGNVQDTGSLVQWPLEHMGDWHRVSFPKVCP